MRRQLDGLLSEDIEDADDELVSRLRGGDREALAELAGRHGERLYQTTFAILRDREEARDAVQDTLVRVMLHGHRFEGRAKFSTWLLVVARNAAVQRLRGRRWHESLDSIENGINPRRVRVGGPDPETACARAEMRSVVATGVRRLPFRLRQAVRLLDLDQLSAVEAAQLLSLSVPALKARHRRGRTMLREALVPMMRNARGQIARNEVQAQVERDRKRVSESRGGRAGG